MNALDPETGKRLWGEPLKATNGAAIMSPIRDGDYLFVGGVLARLQGNEADH